jgi:hypothetical protein
LVQIDRATNIKKHDESRDHIFCAKKRVFFNYIFGAPTEECPPNEIDLAFLHSYCARRSLSSASWRASNDFQREGWKSQLTAVDRSMTAKKIFHFQLEEGL